MTRALRSLLRSSLSAPTLGFALALTACALPFEPGSDLEDPAPAAQLGALVNSAQVSGPYLADANLTLAITGMEIPVSYLLILTQTGLIPDDNATLQIELRDPNAPDVAGPTLPEPAPLTVVGTFRAEFMGVVIPKETFGGMFNTDGMANIVINGEVESDDCVFGTLDLNLISPLRVSLSGPFTAPRQGTQGCQTLTPTPAPEDAQ